MEKVTSRHVGIAIRLLSCVLRKTYKNGCTKDPVVQRTNDWVLWKGARVEGNAFLSEEAIDTNSDNAVHGIVGGCHLLPPFQKDGYTLLRETYLKTPGADRDSNHTIRN